MSSHMSCYVGAFVELPKVNLMEKVTINRCSNPQCIHHSKFNGSSKFCPDCGNSIEQHHYTHSVEKLLDLECLNEAEGNTVEWYDILATTNGLNVYTSNIKGKTGIWHWYDDENKVQLLSSEDMQKMVETFTDQLTKHGFFDLVKKHFDISVQVQFGTFTSWD